MKYKLSNESIEYYGRTLYRIQALKDFGSIKAGDLGGYVESEKNLSQDGDSWVYSKAMVYGNAKVYGKANVFGDAKVHGKANVFGNANVYGNAEVYGNANVYVNTMVYGNANVYGNAEVYGNANVYGYAMVYGNAEVYGKAKVYGGAGVYGNAEVYGNARVFEGAWVFGNAEVFGNAVATSKVFTCTFLQDNITVTDTHVFIGCKVHTFKYWLKNIESIGKENNYTTSEIKLYKLIVFSMIESKTNKQLINIKD